MTLREANAIIEAAIQRELAEPRDFTGQRFFGPKDDTGQPLVIGEVQSWVMVVPTRLAEQAEKLTGGKSYEVVFEDDTEG